ncbi:hypothetical protein D2T29_21700 [Sinirhodobacter populi]|uniref:Uncharacterized protein n=1 Tax=Paenirhodobacter populi TaxID=2306993 RepID=A0A443JZ40_9RHOB|nr:hypothetical protein [Sinirhodobacter populi]RWR25778.1 hypothetical protein D2T29_21700 [Sinirhodobacter populi]
MDQVDEFLVGKYSDYRAALQGVEQCTPFMPYGWFKPPQTVRLDTDLGRQQMVYRDQAQDAARDLANGINHLINLTRRLEAWKTVLEGLDLPQKNDLLHEFVQDLAATALLLPYTLKARFYFAIAHLSHQANCVQQGALWSDDFSTLPEDWGINEGVAARLAKPWRSWGKLIKSLNTVDSGDYKAATDDFRSKHTHRFTPHVELGMTQMMKRLPSQDAQKPCYGIGGSDPIMLDVLVNEEKKQCTGLSKSYRAFQQLVSEQSSVLFGESCT